MILYYFWLLSHYLVVQGIKLFLSLVSHMLDVRVCCLMRFWGLNLLWSWSHVKLTFLTLIIGRLVLLRVRLCWMLLLYKCMVHYFYLQLISMLSFLSFFYANYTLPFAHWLMNYYSLICVVIFIYVFFNNRIFFFETFLLSLLFIKQTNELINIKMFNQVQV